jgi:hypothetical protein
VLLYYLTVRVPVTMLLVVQSESHTTTIPFPIPHTHYERRLTLSAFISKDGHLYYALEYVTKTNSYERHALTIVTITQGKFYTLTTGSSERRWPKMKDRLQVTIDSFNVYY